MKQRSSARIANREKKKQKTRAETSFDSGVDCLSFVLELGAGQVWALLLSEEISNLIQACSSVLSKDFVAKMTMRALDHFANEHKTHLGRQCDCDWMRSIDFNSFGLENCLRAGPFTVNKAMSSLQAPNGALILLSALTLAKRVLLPYCANNWHGTGMFVPVVCLLTTDGERLCNDSAVKKAMNRVCKKAGDRFVYNYTAKHAYNTKDFIYDHWGSIKGPTCQYCDSLPHRQHHIPHRRKWRDKPVQRIRVNCTNLYRPLKAAMEKELQFVRFIPRRKALITEYEGMVAGISPSGVLCGLYIVNGFWPYDS